MEELEGHLIINDTDVWIRYGVFLTEEKEGGRENLTAIMTPAKAKGQVGVDIREHDGTKYSKKLDCRSEEREVTLHFALFARTRTEWLRRYREFMVFLKSGWLEFRFPELDLCMRMFYMDSPAYKPLTYLWREGVQASRFKVRFKEPVPSF